MKYAGRFIGLKSKPHKFGMLFIPERDPAFVEAVGGELDFDFVAGEDFDVVHPHLAGDVAEDYVAVVQLYAEGCVGEGFDHFAVDFNYVVFCHGVPFVYFSQSTHILWRLREPMARSG